MKLKQTSLFIINALMATGAYATSLPGGQINVDVNYWDGPMWSSFNSNGTTAYLMYRDEYMDEQILGGNSGSAWLYSGWEWPDFAYNLRNTPASNWYIDYGGQEYKITSWDVAGAPEVTSVTMSESQLRTKTVLSDTGYVMLNYDTLTYGAPVNWSVSLYKMNGDLVEANLNAEDWGGQMKVNFTETLLDGTAYYLEAYFESSDTLTFTAKSDGDVVLKGKMSNGTSYTYSIDFVTAIPEPSTYALLAGLFTVGAMALKRRKR